MTATDSEPEEHQEENGEEQAAVQRNQFDLAEFSIDDECVDITHTRADHVPDLRRFTMLGELTMRNNLLTEMGSTLVDLSSLTSLDLYENQIAKIENLSSLVNLRTLDLSHNSNSRISIELLELGDNRVKKIENLSQLANLKELYLGKNKLRQLEGLDTLTNLRLLSVPGNRLVKLENIEHLTNLTEIYFSNQGLNDISAIAGLKKLEIVDIADNELETLDSLKELVEITDIWANNNRLSSWAEVDKLAKLPLLETIYLVHNPICKEGISGYRRKVMLALPQVKQIDATLTLI